jgi:hypothetical protein
LDLSDTPRDSRSPTSRPKTGMIDHYSWIAREGGMATKTRRKCAQLLLRVEPAERNRIQASIPRGSFNSVATQLIMDYVRVLETHGSDPHSPVEDPAA